ncbi:ParB N-terminal domain-containing protein [Sandaracinobacter sp. RS1-74]|uniref:ParB/RepB/Spo0J family partition protein n=1 Tax=Sandaracinobacteroides sayramensis TaxID=2913411 RepID=UPI001EDAA224|nr:ParB/RepB/Spo0J family partition protein [Sandaracinobacteroides sayramensis]MCG2841242.1 ParB N-terminal domain-containing protein [Sandaracinobacteroides sayramensis]
MTKHTIVYARALDCHKSPDNVRTRSDADADAELKANIGETGIIIENLIGLPVPRKKGHFEIYAGSRRLEQTQANIAEGKLPEDFMVPILVAKSKAEALEMSQIENYFHLPMNAADECMGFKRIIDKTGKTAADLAIRFGKTERFIEGRLRLADLAPPVFEALRNGEIGIEIAQAYARTSNRERQARVFEELAGSYYRNSVSEIRSRVEAGYYLGNDPKALLVGRDAYAAAGGNIDRDLYSNADTELWTDVDLVDRLADEALAAAADAIREREGVAEVRVIAGTHVPYLSTTGLRRLQGTVLPLTEEQKTRREEISAEIDAINDNVDEDEGYSDEQDARLEALEAELSQIDEREPVYDPEQKAQALAYVIIGDDGKPTMSETLFIAPPETDEDSEADEDDDLTPDEAEGAADADGAGAPVKPLLSQKLIDRLGSMRTELVALHVANDPAFAMDLGTFIMADAANRRFGGIYDLASDLRATVASSRVGPFKSESPAAEAWAKLELDLDRSWLDAGDVTARFDAFRALDDEMRAAWFAWAIARTLHPVHDGESGATFLKHIGRSLDIDVARWWRPTARNFFDAVTRPRILDLFEEIGGAELKSRYGAAKKHDLAVSAEKLFAGKVPVEPEIKEQALAWLPEHIRLVDPVAQEPVPDEAEAPEPVADEAEAPVAANDADMIDVPETGEDLAEAA